MAKLEFRETALNKYAAIEQIDSMMQVMRPSAWWWLSACGVIVVTAIFWSLNGTIITRIHGKGILVHHNGRICRVSAPAAGRIKHVLVKVGERVKADQVLAEIEQPVLLHEVKAQESLLASLKSQGEKERVSAWRAQNDLEEAKLRYQSASQVIAGEDGVIYNFLAFEGQLIEPYQPVFVLQTGGVALQALVFFPADVGKEVQVGQLVEISPQWMDKDQDGVILGRVSSVSGLPLSAAGVAALVPETELVQNWYHQVGAPIAARVDLIADPSSRNKYKCTSAQGENMELSSGTLVNAAAQARVTRVISLLIPALNQTERIRRSE